ncbi:MAG: dTDP-4-amino-4,6-dideoxygalactose transaminase [Bernardetiaceae bacterium]|nr:dTDP-4-amino-4,6-dideoxygalactose transaminase [Bernardetiaceae bacterium]
MHTIPFNKPYLTGRETQYIQEAVASGKISGDGIFTKKCHDFFKQQYGFSSLLTTSCTDALELAALLLEIREGDEVIAPSYTFVSTVNAFVLRGAKIVFADSEAHSPNIDVAQIESLISPRTKAIVVVHYAGMACDMDKVMDIAERHNLFVVEDAAQAIDAYYQSEKHQKPIALGRMGELAAFSFHETKNIISGEGGMLVVNDAQYFKRAEIIREKGTNRSAFFRGEIDKYGWVDVGSSFLPSDIIAAFLYAQLENLEAIQRRRREIWHRYYTALKPLEQTGYIQLPTIPVYATNNAHMFYLLCENLEQRSALIAHLKSQGISAVFHYLSLHKSPFYQSKHDGRHLPHCDRYADTLLRLPMFYELTEVQQDRVISSIKSFFNA